MEPTAVIDPNALQYGLAGLVAALCIKEAFSFGRAALARRNGKNGHDAEPLATKLDVAQAEARILAELRHVSDAVHGRVTEVSERVARLEGRGVAT